MKILGQNRRGFRRGLALGVIAAALQGYQASPGLAQETQATSSAAAPASSDEGKQSDEKQKVQWRDLLAEKELPSWKSTNFGGEGTVSIKPGSVEMALGGPLTGINFTGEIPKDLFEIELEANRLQGGDFFCGLTFPVGDEFCSYIAGGWGGSLIGLSCVDNEDAANNSTTQFQEFKNEKWYRFRLRVDKQHITAWIDDKEYIKQVREGHKFRTRTEVDASQPLGLAAYVTKVAIRNFQIRTLSADEAKGTLTPEKAP